MICVECDGLGWVGDDTESGNWSRVCPECDGEGIIEFVVDERLWAR